jgi:hypothetical protein
VAVLTELLGSHVRGWLGHGVTVWRRPLIVSGAPDGYG